MHSVETNILDSRTFSFGEEQQRWRIPLTYPQSISDIAATKVQQALALLMPRTTHC